MSTKPSLEGHYYFQKYTMWYSAIDENGMNCVYFTLPMTTLTTLYQEKTGQQAKSFFDCGCGTGKLLNQAEEMGLSVKGIDVAQYPVCTLEHQRQQHHIETVSILDYDKPIHYDIAYCNGSLTYLDEKKVDIALHKLKSAKLLIAIHNTTEDEKSAGYPLSTEPDSRLIRSQKWWLNKFKQTGFKAEFDHRTHCFLAWAKGRQRT